MTIQRHPSDKVLVDDGDPPWSQRDFALGTWSDNQRREVVGSSA
jgi:hypothetical protein